MHIILTSKKQRGQAKLAQRESCQEVNGLHHRDEDDRGQRCSGFFSSDLEARSQFTMDSSLTANQVRLC